MFALFLDTGAWIGILAGAVVAAIGLTILVFFLLRKNSKSKAGKEADGIIHDAKIKAEVIVKDARLEAKQALFEAKQEAENNARERKNEIALEEQKLNLRINAIDARDAALVEKENNLEKKSETLDSSIAAYKKRQEELNEKIDAILVELEKVAGMSTQEAHDEIMARVESKMSMEIAQYIKNAEEEARDTAKAKAIDLLTLACQKYAQDVATERTVKDVTSKSSNPNLGSTSLSTIPQRSSPSLASTQSAAKSQGVPSNTSFAMVVSNLVVSRKSSPNAVRKSPNPPRNTVRTPASNSACHASTKNFATTSVASITVPPMVRTNSSTAWKSLI